MYFMRDDGFVCVYVAGACSDNGGYKRFAGRGVWFGNYHPMTRYERVNGRQTTNVAAIQAARRAIEQAYANGIRYLRIFSSSKLTVYGIDIWIKEWLRNGWRKSNGSPVVNRDDFIALYNAVQKMESNFGKVKWTFVTARRKNRGIENAKRLAQKAIKLRYRCPAALVKNSSTFHH